jgi:neuronal guanine nucleotide exchange factor
VINSGILENVSNETKRLHEAMFEVITSEASYLKSLNILMKHFAQSPKLSGSGDSSVISKWDHKRLFADVISVRHCSEKFLEDLEKRWQSSVLLDGLCEVVRDHAMDNFQVYVKYCSNQVDQGKLLGELR